MMEQSVLRISGGCTGTGEVMPRSYRRDGVWGNPSHFVYRTASLRHLAASSGETGLM